MFLLGVQAEQSASSFSLATSGQHKSGVAVAQLSPALGMWECRKGCTQVTWGKWNIMDALQNSRFNLPNIRTLASMENISEGRERSIFVVGRFQRALYKMSWWWRQIWKWMHTEVWILSQRVPTSPSCPMVSSVIS